MKPLKKEERKQKPFMSLSGGRPEDLNGAQKGEWEWGGERGAEGGTGGSRCVYQHLTPVVVCCDHTCRRPWELQLNRHRV